MPYLNQITLNLWVRVDLGVMEMKGYTPFPKAQGLKPNQQMRNLRRGYKF